MSTQDFIVETGNNKCSSIKRMNNQNVVCSQPRILSKNKKKWTTDTCNNMKELKIIMLHESEPGKKEHMLYPAYTKF